MQNNKTPLSKQKIFTIVSSVLLVLSHIAVFAAIALSYEYYGIYPSLFGSLVAIVLCILLMIDVIFVVGANYKDLLLKIVTCVLAFFIFVGGTVGTYAVAKVNGMVNSVLDGSSNKKELYSGVFVCYDKFNNFDSLSDLDGKRVGMLTETTNGLSYIAASKLDKEKIDWSIEPCKSNTELMEKLIRGDIDAAVFTSAYRDIYKNDENTDYKNYFDNLIDFYSFSEELKVETNKKTKDITKEPFNVLLIGWSRTDVGSTVGLADSIIVATINPLTYTVSMMSIARDSFVPIACYGGEYDKINSGRSTSRACFIETVENFLGMDIDYYMEADYLAIVAIVNWIGGVEIDNPVDFELDGYFVPAGKYVADGWQALHFCRERHSMPNGDFDRQKHQKEVIIAIARKFIEAGDVSLALGAMNWAGDYLSTDFTLSELTSVFNLLLNTKNFTGLDTFDLVDFQTLRITGYGGILYYSYSMKLPLWVYLIYQGSYDESINHINEVMGKYATYDQVEGHVFSARYPYVREPFYSLDYKHEFVYSPDPMPNYWANLKGMTLPEAMEWASSKGVTLDPEFIPYGDPRYNVALDGQVVDQSVKYGDLCSEHPKGTITVMGTGQIDESKFIPNFVGHSYEKVVEWAQRYGIPYKIEFDENADGVVGKVTYQNFSPYFAVEKMDDKLRVTVKAGISKVTFDLNGQSDEIMNPIEIKTGDEPVSLPKPVQRTITKENGDKYHFIGWFTTKEKVDNEKPITKTSEITGDTKLYARWEKECAHEYGEWDIIEDSTCSQVGQKQRECGKCGEKDIQQIPLKEHDYVQTGSPIGPTCTEQGSITYTCNKCKNTKTETVAPLGHDTDSGTCSRCGQEVE